MSERKHGSQLVDEDDAYRNPELLEEARKALSTPLVMACNEALEKVAMKFKVVACDPDGGECSFPQCLVMGCEAEPEEPSQKRGRR
jgi:hypothetical protein